MQRRGRGGVVLPWSCANRPEKNFLHKGEIIGHCKGGQSLKDFSSEIGIHIKSVRLRVIKYEAEVWDQTQSWRVKIYHAIRRQENHSCSCTKSQENGHNNNKGNAIRMSCSNNTEKASWGHFTLQYFSRLRKPSLYSQSRMATVRRAVWIQRPRVLVVYYIYRRAYILFSVC